MRRSENAKMRKNPRMLIALTHIRINAYTYNLTGGYLDGILD